VSEAVVYAFYVWVIVSLVILVVRIARHLLSARSRPTGATAPSVSGERPPARRGTETVDDPIPSRVREEVPERQIPDEAVADEAVADEAVTADRVAGDDAGASPVRTNAPAAQPDTAPAARPVTAPVAEGRGKSLSDALRGVRLPFDLVPTADTVEPSDDRRVSLTTSAASPAEVGTAIADELERLGFEVAAHRDDEAQAIRGDDVIGLRIIPDADRTVGDGRRRFPDLPVDSVALVLWLVR
jgi:hypothetical protein